MPLKPKDYRDARIERLDDAKMICGVCLQQSNPILRICTLISGGVWEAICPDCIKHATDLVTPPPVEEPEPELTDRERRALNVDKERNLPDSWMRTCENCEEVFSPKTKEQRFCGRRCSALFLTKKNREAKGAVKV